MTGTVMVAGAGGFVGSHTLQALQDMNIPTVALVRDPKRLPPGYTGEVRRGDIRDTAFVEQALEGVDSVCACAAWTSAWGHADASRRFFLEPTLAFLDACGRKGVKRVVYPSSTTAPVLRSLAVSGLRGGPEKIWPHLANVLRIEDHLRSLAARGMTTLAPRLGMFVGERYGMGLLPLLLPRLRSHLVPWVGKGATSLPLVAGQDIGRAMALAATREGMDGYSTFDVVGEEIPSAREVFRFLHDAYGYPLPHFGVSFPMANAFARLMESLSRFTPWDPFITRSIVLLLEETATSNETASRLLGYVPRVHWKDAVRAQLAEMQRDRFKGLRMAPPVPAAIRGPAA